MKKNKNLLYYFLISGFVLLYIITAFISFCHAIEFFEIGNMSWMATLLAGVFELGQMVVLFSLLLTDNKKTTIPWILLIILTSVQVVGNVFSVFKYISLSDTGYYVYLQKPLIDWWLSGVSVETIQVIISWIIGALLPIIALFMTSMVSNNIKLLKSKENDVYEENKDIPEKIEDKLDVKSETVEPKNEEAVDEIRIDDVNVVEQIEVPHTIEEEVHEVPKDKEKVVEDTFVDTTEDTDDKEEVIKEERAKTISVTTENIDKPVETKPKEVIVEQPQKKIFGSSSIDKRGVISNTPRNIRR